jgi:glucokinase
MSQEHSDRILVFDIGGTSIRAALYSQRTGRITEVLRRATPSFKTARDPAGAALHGRLLDCLQETAREVAGDEGVAAVCIGFPGPVGPGGEILAAPTVWGEPRSGRPVLRREELERLWPETPLLLLNDMSAAGYRYLDRPDESLCVVTVSSGIGQKIFVDGRPLTGPGGRGGEIGHWRVDLSPDAPLCDCGRRGHLGAVASGRGTSHHVERLAAEDPEGFRDSLLAERLDGATENLSNEIFADAFRAGDAFTLRVARRMSRPLGQALAAIHAAAGVERFVIVGGFALALGERYREQLAEFAAACVWDLGADWNRMVELGEADDEAGLVGAGRYAAEGLAAGTE